MLPVVDSRFKHWLAHLMVNYAKHSALVVVKLHAAIRPWQVKKVDGFVAVAIVKAV